MGIWILGASGRIGSAVAAGLASRGIEPVLVGRNPDKLPAGSVIAAGADQIAAEITRRRPTVVVNTIGDYAASALTIARAGLPAGTHYVDVANDLVALPRMLGAHDEAAAAGSTFVTGAGFGVLATEAVVAQLCEGRPAPSRVRVDALASVATAGGVMGEGYAATILDVLTTGGRRIENGRLVPSRLGAGVQTLTPPDGTTVSSAEVPSGELFAARAASNAPFVTVTSALAPTAPLARAALPALSRLLSLAPMRRFAVSRLAGLSVKPAPRPRPHSWGHAVVEWPDGARREGWLRAGDGMDYTAAVLTEAAVRLSRGEAKPGAYTPAAALGADLAEAAGGEFLLDR
ncbi:saccharopine dehydrogenase NADP-binding domain-containing protein [Actinoplanes sp. LDG1-06]|uniref:Saccharopine dehydrogenase NADP-binding domain-containing protein n=1 Tax=Paractinoplanes ovalisporus TaxID=2810368 RepID=A0ABS2A3K8_9ACTN|nr:saccharopine dehydrogenase NADP-binding domain-containing protein [Actinoplanes ovalisporus]MBM2614428.1 saccharopine dehydrogenase NADP-binding domain-containing protein [Actinoplanes ovalisporus]